jgi:hypothetical protein
MKRGAKRFQSSHNDITYQPQYQEPARDEILQILPNIAN